ncbi:hypothetical protein [[Bacillus] enclensis]|uniref:hypothetical protein n=1 Tax=[Bacillus] enclensis TaxID=1402860 RepID=UPI00094484C1|nr:hypothetical protein [[Bacillus] enclensis]
MIGVQDEDSCGKSSLCETPQACRGGSRATRGKRSLARKSLALFRVHSEMFVFKHENLCFVLPPFFYYF